ncbi:MAG TPA: hypothetical protein QF753_21600 [Victivallales bacterium]|nr:hypothetical protein [Victivallales bacterium]
MKKITAKKLLNTHTILENYNRENSDFEFDIPSLMKYCVENEIRSLLKDNKLADSQINEIFQNINFNVKIKQNSKNKNLVKINVQYDKLT